MKKWNLIPLWAALCLTLSYSATYGKEKNPSMPDQKPLAASLKKSGQAFRENKGQIPAEWVRYYGKCGGMDFAIADNAISYLFRKKGTENAMLMQRMDMVLVGAETFMP